MVCKVLLLARFTGRDVGRLVVCGGKELRPDDCVRGSCLIRQAVLLYYGSCLIQSAVFLIQIPSARVWRRVYAAPDCLLVKLAD